MNSTMIALLAAGSATRFGGGKLDAPLQGRPLGRWALDRARAQGGEPVVVCGTNPPAFAAGCRLIINHDATAGMGTSIRLAAHAAHRSGAARLLIMLADMPFVSDATLRALADGCGTGAAACTYPDGALGPPACFHASLYPLLTALPPEKGAQGLLRAISGLRQITPAPTELADIDTQEDLARLG